MFFGIDFHPLIVRHGYAVVFFVVLLEGAGSPLPGETALVLAAVYAGATGRLDIATVLLVAVVGGILGGTIGYWIGRSVSSDFLRRYGKWIGLTENRLALGRHLFQSHGGKIVFFGRFIAVLRIVAALLAGLNRYDFGRFFLFNGAGVITWAAIMGLGGYFFGDAMTRVSGPLGAIGLAFAAAVVVGFFIVLRRQEKKFESKLSEDAFAKDGEAKLETTDPS
ncbi:MAG: DedA family protein [Methylovirgula sp.]|uniref:DedA family protein n=1 Tax=Methylovirgula sp. TaxID=1978224 RepID=UPI0030768700